MKVALATRGVVGDKGLDSAQWIGSVAYPTDSTVRQNSVDSSEQGTETVLGDNFALWYGVGCDGVGHHQDPPKSSWIDIDDLLAFLARLGYARGAIDVVESFGGVIWVQWHAGGHFLLENPAGSRPRNMCLRTCIGIQALMGSIRGSRLVCEEGASRLYPVALGLPKRRGRPRIDPGRIVDTVRGVIRDFPACIGRLHERRPDHTRNNELPELCRHYNISDEA